MGNEKFVIEGGKHLEGTIEARGAKNAAFPILAASLLTKEKCVVDNIPLIEDVFRMIDILKSMGVEVKWLSKRKIQLQSKNVDPSKIEDSLILKLRGSVLFFGPLLGRFHEATLPQPGGCIIGARPINTHLDAFKQLGVKVTPKKNRWFKLEFPGKLKSHKVILNEFSVTATENVLLFLSNIPEKVVIENADEDYENQELVKVLKQMGVKIKGAGTHHLVIQGSKHLKGFKHKIIFDPIEAGTFILMAAASKSHIKVQDTEIDFLQLFLKRLRDFGLPWKQIGKKEIEVFPWTELEINRVQSLPYPGLATDLLPLFGVLATQLNGLTLLHDPLYESRLKYLEELNKMGAQIIFADPHRAIVSGPTPLYGRIVTSPDLRGGASLIAAALIAKGKTVIGNIYQIDRGYERMEERLQKLGANIKRVKEQ